MDSDTIRQVLTVLLTDIADQARQDALRGESNIGSIFKSGNENLRSLDAKIVEQAIEDINKATATKEGARRLINGIMVAAKAAAKVAFPS